MATRIVTVHIDDLSGVESADALTRVFSLDGTTYEIDLTPESYGKLVEALEPYVRAGRRRGGAGKKSASPKPTGRQDTAKIRDWGRKNGYTLSDRGRIPAPVVDAYNAALSKRAR